MTENIKIRLKVDNLEVEYEGNSGFFKSELDGLLGKMCNLAAQVRTKIGDKPPDDNENTPPAILDSDLAFDTIVANLDITAPAEFVIYAVAYTQLIQKKLAASRQEIIDLLKTTNCTKSTIKNVSAIIDRVKISGSILKNSSGKYALSNTEKKKIGIEFANIK